MMRIPAALILVSALLVTTLSCADTKLIESVSVQYSENYPGLESYRVKLKTNKIDEMLTRMTASIPKDMPRPDSPELMKFWNRDSGTVVRSMTATAAPYMQQMINRFSQRFAVDLGSLFLPASKVAEREKLLKQATIKTTKSEIAGNQTHHYEITFPEPTDVGGAFYGTSLDLPQRKINKLSLDINPVKRTLVLMNIESEEREALTVEIRHLQTKNNSLPSEVSITSPDGSVEETFVTTFKEIEGYQLPIRQERKIRRPGLEDEMLVEFIDYELNPNQ